ncbi:MAG: hypothetical protein ACXWL5_04505, partial [Candidatus Chromulinivorax sp.]
NTINTNMATSAQATAIEGTSFDTATDSLHVISGKVATATNLASLGSNSDVSSIHTDFVHLGASSGDISSIYSDFQSLGIGEGDVSNLSAALSLLATIVQVNNLGTINDTSNVVTTNIEQGIVTPFIINPTSNSTAANGKVYNQGGIIKIASSNAALTTPVAMTGANLSQQGYIDTYNTALTTALTDVDTVIADIKNTEISYITVYNDTITALNSLIAAINAFSDLAFYDVIPTSGYSVASISAALNELYLTLTYVLALTTPTP